MPLKRRKDFGDREVDNAEVMQHLTEVRTYILVMCTTVNAASNQALELGDAVCLFPEGMSRYHPTIAPLKTGGTTIDLLPYNDLTDGPPSCKNGLGCSFP